MQRTCEGCVPLITLFLTLLFAQTLAAQNSCPKYLAQEALYAKNIATYRSALIEMHTAFPQASDNVKSLLAMTQKSWLEHGRPDKIETKDFQSFIDVHHEQLKSAIEELKKLASEKPDDQKYILEFTSFGKKTLAELKALNRKHIMPQSWLEKWASKAGSVYDLLYSVKSGNPVINTYEIFRMQRNSKNRRFSNDLTNFLPIFSAFSWRELNDVWSIGITPVTLTKEFYYADGRGMTPGGVTDHDLGHVYIYTKELPFDIKDRLDIFLENYQVYKKFRNLQDQETDDRKREIREGVWFYFTHEINSTPKTKDKLSNYLQRREILQGNLAERFQFPYDFGDGFNPKVTRAEIYDEVDWFYKNVILANF